MNIVCELEIFPLIFLNVVAYHPKQWNKRLSLLEVIFYCIMFTLHVGNILSLPYMLEMYSGLNLATRLRIQGIE